MHAVDAYEVSLRERGLVGVSVTRARHHLDQLLRLDVHGTRPLAWLTGRRGAELYTELQIGRAVDTHRNGLSVGKAFGTWCAKRGWLRGNPFGEVEPVGRRRRGKPQIHVDEARRLVDACLVERSRASIAVAVALLFGLRATEVARRQIRDLDDGGKLLWVPKGKTAAARRCLEVPPVLRQLLVELAGARPAAAYLFGSADLAAPTRYWVYYHCRRLCAVAGVPVVPPHGLRGTHSTLAIAAGATPSVVAAAMGHTSPELTLSTYTAPGTRETASARATLRVIDGGAGNLSTDCGYQRRGKIV